MLKRVVVHLNYICAIWFLPHSRNNDIMQSDEEANAVVGGALTKNESLEKIEQ